jgi:uroporphyrinogen decarboxylase
MKDSIQRVINTIQHKSSDRIPRGEIIIDDSIVEKELACGMVGFDERLQFSSLLGLDICCLSPQPVHSGGLPQPEDLVWPDLRKWVDRSGLFTFAILDGSFGWGGRIFGFEKFFSICLRDQPGLRDFNQGVERLNRDLGRRLAEEGIHGLILADDLAYTGGLFVSPRTMEEHFLPCLSRQADNLLSMGLPLFFHSDGNFMDILPRIAAMGFHGFHCIDPDSNMDVAVVRSRAGRDLCLWGTLTARELEGCEDQKAQECLSRRIADHSSSGSFILGTTSGLFKGLRIDGLRSIYSRV